MAFLSDRQLLTSVSGDKTIRLWNANMKVSCSILKGHSDWVRAVAFSLDSQLLTSVLDNKTVRL